MRPRLSFFGVVWTVFVVVVVVLVLLGEYLLADDEDFNGDGLTAVLIEVGFFFRLVGVVVAALLNAAMRDFNDGMIQWCRW